MLAPAFRLIAPLLLMSLVGCTSNSTTPDQNVVEKTSAARFQRMGTAPSGGALLIDEQPLLPGDILLSSSTGINSLGIRVFSLAAVSHAALYLGDGQVAEAVGSGVAIVPLASALEHSSALVAFRYPGLTSEQATRIQAFAISKQGSSYNYKGIVMMAPYMLTKRVCELSLFNRAIRDRCLTLLAIVQLGDSDANAANSEAFFCSQFVLEAYNHAGHPISHSEPAWITPADLLHMRQGDRASFSSHQALEYIGHLKQRAKPQPTLAVNREGRQL